MKTQLEMAQKRVAELEAKLEAAVALYNQFASLANKYHLERDELAERLFSDPRRDIDSGVQGGFEIVLSGFGISHRDKR